ncbi:unnamed protein product [Zymoseptoria tritici ST99CH_3D7]|uniref:Uncharacterized protein n=1 Tax=Zymoseptoria tritici (strain ST99CH_3D7) TaxID=1276538 RepID=A0A1X7S265_ZYMT9|nr:unnamed protein product [Zymoseptoria tritici ST99CH_3D7]
MPLVPLARPLVTYFTNALLHTASLLVWIYHSLPSVTVPSNIIPSSSSGGVPLTTFHVLVEVYSELARMWTWQPDVVGCTRAEFAAILPLVRGAV